ncbi:MAG: flavin reductase [Thermoplasmatota archaeon]
MVGETLFKVTYGMYIVSSREGSRLNGLIINTANQVTSSPPQVSINISKANLTHDMIIKSRVFSISILRKDTPMRFIGKWGFKSGRDIDKFEGTKYKFGPSGAPIVLENTIGYMDLELVDHLDVSTHTIFVGEVIESEIIEDSEPLTYNYYRDVKGGRSSKNAPTYEGWGSLSKDMSRFICGKCGYVYDPMAGDRDGKIPPDTSYEELPSNWVCPLCGAPKSDFTRAN